MKIFCLIFLILDSLNSVAGMINVLFDKKLTAQKGASKFTVFLLRAVVSIYVCYLMFSNYARL
jgi:hypothetical protein